MPECNDEGDAEGHISSFSNTKDCVRVAKLPTGNYLVRHSTDATTGVEFTRAEWKAFVAGVKAAEFDF